MADVKVTHGIVQWDERRGVSDFVRIRISGEHDRHVLVSVSPTGKSVQVHVDGKRVHCG